MAGERRGMRFAVCAGVLAALGCSQSTLASEPPSKSEAKEIERAFLDGRDVATEVGKIRLSTVDERFASVSYSVTIPELAASRRAPESMKAPSPALLKEAKGKWKPVPKAPKKVKNDLKKKAKSDIVITGDVVAVLSRAPPARRAGISPRRGSSIRGRGPT